MVDDDENGDDDGDADVGGWDGMEDDEDIVVAGVGSFLRGNGNREAKGEEGKTVIVSSCDWLTDWLCEGGWENGGKSQKEKLYFIMN